MLRELYESAVSRGFYGRPRERILISSVMEEVERLEPGSLLVVQLPTGYGKTAIPHTLALASLATGCWSQRSIHVLPLRSIADDAWNRFIKGLVVLGASRDDAAAVSGLQMMGRADSPFFNKVYVSTTFDTFSLACFKLPPAELPSLVAGLAKGREVYGHFEVARGAILESCTVFDEPHILAESGQRLAEVYVALVHFLACMGVPTVHMSASLPRELVEGLKRISTEAGRGIKILAYGTNGFRDKDFENEQLSKSISTSVIGEGALEEVISEAASKWCRVLVVVNTVRRAVDAWKRLRDFGALLLHGRMTVGDRLSVLSSIRRSEKWILVATQVIEAGVDISTQCLVSDACPPTSLVQRAGRVARFESEDEGEIIIVRRAPVVYEESVCERALREIEEAGKVYWRLPEAEGGLGYQQLMDKVGGRGLPRLRSRLRNLLFPRSTPMESIFEMTGKGLPRELSIIPTLVAESPPRTREEYEVAASERGLGLSTDVVEKLMRTGFEVKFLVAEAEGLEAREDRNVLVRILNAGPAASLLMMAKGISSLLIGERAYRWLAYGGA